MYFILLAFISYCTWLGGGGGVNYSLLGHHPSYFLFGNKNLYFCYYCCIVECNFTVIFLIQAIFLITLFKRDQSIISGQGQGNQF